MRYSLAFTFALAGLLAGDATAWWHDSSSASATPTSGGGSNGGSSGSGNGVANANNAQVAAAAASTPSTGPTYSAGAYPFPQPAQPGQVTPGGDGTSFNNVVTLTGTSSYVFQSLSQTSTFSPGSANIGNETPIATYNPDRTATTIYTNPPVSIPSLSGSRQGSSSGGSGGSGSKNAATRPAAGSRQIAALGLSSGVAVAAVLLMLA